jgi:aspartyl/asparaginyl-tRNA synthetase
LSLQGLQVQLLLAPLCIEDLLGAVPFLQVGTTLRIGGWVKTGREAGAGAFAFLEINDGSCFDSLQVRQV